MIEERAETGTEIGNVIETENAIENETESGIANTSEKKKSLEAHQAMLRPLHLIQHHSGVPQRVRRTINLQKDI